MLTWYITLYTILVQKWGMGAYMVIGAYKVLYSNLLRLVNDMMCDVGVVRVNPNSGTGDRRLLEKVLFFGWLDNVPPTCWCISGTDLLRQLYVLPH